MLGIACFFVAVIISCNQAESHADSEVAAISQDSLIKRGNFLVSSMGCNDCHSPKVFGPNGPEPDTSRLLSGHPANAPLPKFDTSTLRSWVLFTPDLTAAVGPWGVSFAANLTPDSSGIGAWTEAQFFRAIREGKSKGLEGNRMLLPPMPWFNYALLSDHDLRAIFTYLKSIKPVKNMVPLPIPPGSADRKG